MTAAGDASRKGGGTAGEILNMRRTVLEIKKARYARRPAPVRQSGTSAETEQHSKTMTE